MHPIPTEITTTAFGPTGTTSGIGHWRAGDIHDGRYRYFRQVEHRLPLRISDVIVHHIARAKEDGHSHIAGRGQSLINARYEGIHPHGGRLAPVVVPNIHRHHADARRIHLLVGDDDFARLGVAGLEAPANGHRGNPRQESQTQEEGEPRSGKGVHGIRGGFSSYNRQTAALASHSSRIPQDRRGGFSEIPKNL